MLEKIGPAKKES